MFAARDFSWPMRKFLSAEAAVCFFFFFMTIIIVLCYNYPKRLLWRVGGRSVVVVDLHRSLGRGSRSLRASCAWKRD